MVALSPYQGIRIPHEPPVANLGFAALLRKPNSMEFDYYKSAPELYSLVPYWTCLYKEVNFLRR